MSSFTATVVSAALLSIAPIDQVYLYITCPIRVSFEANATDLNEAKQFKALMQMD